jgi:hypothetical protein
VLIGLYLVHQVKPTYKASGSVLLSTSGSPARPATTPSTVAAVNPYANMDQSQLAYLVSQTAGGSTLREEMVAAGASGTYSVVAIAGEPALTVSTMAATPDAALTSYHTLVKLLNSELDSRQLAVGVPADTLVGVHDWTTPSNALPQNAAKVKALIIVAIIGLLVTLALVFLVDSVLTNRLPWAGWRDHDDDEAESDARLTGPVAVPTRLDSDGAEVVPIIDDEVAVASRTSRTSRLEFEAASTSDRSSSHADVAEASHLGGLPPWSPPEQRPRAAGS